MIPARGAETAAFLTGLALALGLERAVAPGLAGQLLILAPAVAVLGLPHGALDLPMAEALRPRARRADLARFAAGYLGLATLVAGAWWLAPEVALAAFLAVSALHFAGDWAAEGRLVRAAGGVSAIGAPALLQTGDVAGLFARLGPGAAGATTLAQALAAAGAAAGLLAALSLAAAPRRRARAGAELAGIWLGAALLPPLLYFAAYFCLLHSLRHFVATLAALPDRARARRMAGGVTLVTVLGAGAVLGALHLGAGRAADSAVLQVIFVGLAALTVPHMLLVEAFRRRAPAVAPQRPGGSESLS